MELIRQKVIKMLHVASEERIPLPLILPSRIILVWKSCNFARSFPKRERDKITWANIDVFYHNGRNALHGNTGRIFSCFWVVLFPLHLLFLRGENCNWNSVSQVAGWGVWIWSMDREVTISHGGQAHHEEETSTWWLKCQPWFFPAFPAHTFLSEPGMKCWCSGNYHMCFAPCLLGRTDLPALSFGKKPRELPSPGLSAKVEIKDKIKTALCLLFAC